MYKVINQHKKDWAAAIAAYGYVSGYGRVGMVCKHDLYNVEDIPVFSPSIFSTYSNSAERLQQVVTMLELLQAL